MPLLDEESIVPEQLLLHPCLLFQPRETGTPGSLLSTIQAPSPLALSDPWAFGVEFPQPQLPTAATSILPGPPYCCSSLWSSVYPLKEVPRGQRSFTMPCNPDRRTRFQFWQDGVTEKVLRCILVPSPPISSVSLGIAFPHGK